MGTPASRHDIPNRFRAVLLVLLTVNLLFNQGCTVTQPKLWEGGLPPKSVTPGERDAVFRKFAFKRIRQGPQDDLVIFDENEIYTLGSYKAVLEEFAPGYESKLEAVRGLKRYQTYGFWIGLLALAGSFATPDTAAGANTRTGLYVVTGLGIGTAVGLSLMTRDTFDSVRDEYLKNLNKRLGRAGDAARARPSRGLALQLSLPL